jgi:hypothetical protein
VCFAKKFCPSSYGNPSKAEPLVLKAMADPGNQTCSQVPAERNAKTDRVKEWAEGGD